jgi:hypothetical protein
MSARKKRIGIDFDNTIVGYDGAFLAAAKKANLLTRDFSGDKRAIRDAIRLLPEGELAWQRLQGLVYGEAIDGAALFEGVDAFLGHCRDEGHTVFIVSHKTEHGHFDPKRIPLRKAALSWMKRRGFFGTDGYAIPLENVFFEVTRADKLRRIASLECTHFIDDLEEVLSDPSFPPIKRILFAKGRPTNNTLPYPICATWKHIEAEVFGERE